MEVLSLSPLGLIVLGYALGTTVALLVLAGLRQQPAPPSTVMVGQDTRTSEGFGCLAFIVLAILFLIFVIVVSFGGF